MTTASDEGDSIFSIENIPLNTYSPLTYSRFFAQESAPLAPANSLLAE
jgi:hypothetical protein